MVGLEKVFDFGRLIIGYSERYGTAVWPLLYQCGARCRLEHRERLRRVLERDAATAAARFQSLSVPFDAARPWDLVWVAAADDAKFWDEEPALIILIQT